MQVKNLFVPVAGAILFTTGAVEMAPVHAEPIEITNPSFEQPFVSDGSYTIEDITGWSVINTGNPGVLNPSSDWFPSVPDGEQTLYSNGGTVIQTLLTTLAPNTTYNLGVSIGRRLDFTDFPGFTVELYAGDTLLVSGNETNILLPEPGTFQRLNLTYISPSSVPPNQPLEIRLKSAGAQTNFDFVTLDASSDGTNVGARVDSYMVQAGLPTSGQLGEERWFNACDTRVQQGAGTFNSGVTKPCSWGLDGWRILDFELEVIENKYGRGSYTTSTLPAGSDINISLQEIGSKYKLAIERAISASDLEAKNKLELEYQRHQQLILQYASNKNTFILSVTANGGLGRKSVIHVKARVRAVYVGD